MKSLHYEYEGVKSWLDGKCVFTNFSLVVLLVLSLTMTGQANAANWSVDGGDLNNTSHAASEKAINADAVENRGLKVKWRYDTTKLNAVGSPVNGDMWSPPLVHGDTVYATTAGLDYANSLPFFEFKLGVVHSVDAQTGVEKWHKTMMDLSREVTQLLGSPLPLVLEFSRNTPVVHGDLLIFGTSSFFTQAGKYATTTLILNSLFIPLYDHIFVPVVDANGDPVLDPDGNLIPQFPSLPEPLATNYPFLPPFYPVDPTKRFGGVGDQFGAYAIALNRHTGDLVWAKRVDEDPGAMITSSPVEHRGIVYLGVAAPTYVESIYTRFISFVVPAFFFELIDPNFFFNPGAFDPTVFQEERRRFAGPLLEPPINCDVTGSEPPVGCSNPIDGNATTKITKQPTFRGSVIALDAKSGDILWKTYMAPEGYAGNSVWGSSFVIDKKRDLMYVPTGNNSTVPRVANLCEKERLGTLSEIPSEVSELSNLLAAISSELPGNPQVVCGDHNSTSVTPASVRLLDIYDPISGQFTADVINLNDAFVPTEDQDTKSKTFGNYVNAIVAIHLKDKNNPKNTDPEDNDGIDSDGDGSDVDVGTQNYDRNYKVKAGDVAWVMRSREYDPFFIECLKSGGFPIDFNWGFPIREVCPAPGGYDLDIGVAPMLIKRKGQDDILVAASKSGMIFALNPDDNGSIIYRKKLSVQSEEGGIQRGLATDGEYIYTSHTNRANTDDDFNPTPKVPHVLCHTYNLSDELVEEGLTGTPEDGCTVANNSDAVTYGQFISANRVSDGATVWQSALPHGAIDGQGSLDPRISQGLAGITVADGVLFVGTGNTNAFGGENRMYALRTKGGDPQTSNGEVIWNFKIPNDGMVVSEAAIAGGVIYWGTGLIGYIGSFGPGLQIGNGLYAFELCPKGTKVSEDKLSCEANEAQ